MSYKRNKTLQDVLFCEKNTSCWATSHHPVIDHFSITACPIRCYSFLYKQEVEM